MRKSFLHKVLACVLSAALVLSCAVITACDKSAKDGVAATIMGQEITEQQVTDYIDSFRSVMSYTVQDAWKNYLEQNENTPEALRQTTIVELAGDIVIEQVSEERGIELDQDAVDKKIDALKETMAATDDESWKATLEKYQMTEDELRGRTGKEVLANQVYEAVVDKTDPTDQDIASYIHENMLGSTTKHFEVLYSANYPKLQAALDTIKKAPTTAAGFAAAKKKADGETIVYEDYGWDVDPETTTTMQTELAKLKAGEVSVDVASDSDVNAYEVIYVADNYTFPSKADDIDVSMLPSTLKKMLSKRTQSRVWDISCSSWLSNQISANLSINGMPSGLSYDVDVDASSYGDNAQDDSSEVNASSENTEGK